VSARGSGEEEAAMKTTSKRVAAWDDDAVNPRERAARWPVRPMLLMHRLAWEAKPGPAGQWGMTRWTGPDTCREWEAVADMLARGEHVATGRRGSPMAAEEILPAYGWRYSVIAQVDAIELITPAAGGGIADTFRELFFDVLVHCDARAAQEHLAARIPREKRAAPIMDLLNEAASKISDEIAGKKVSQIKVALARQYKELARGRDDVPKEVSSSSLKRWVAQELSRSK
jgi:hypothetical protein